MSARLQRIHAILRAGNVPCGLTSRPGIGTVLHAGTPEHGPWDVLVRDAGDQLWLHHAGGVDELPHDVTDSLVADVVKVRVVQAWADRGDPEARALIARLHNPSQPHHAAYRDRTTQPRQHMPPFTTVAFVDPLQFAATLIQTANRAGWAMLTGHPASAAFTWSNPWGTLLSVQIKG